MDKHVDIILTFLSLFDISTLPDLVWIDACDMETIDYCKYRLVENNMFCDMINLLKTILKE
jgi:hypothetical protein